MERPRPQEAPAQKASAPEGVPVSANPKPERKKTPEQIVDDHVYDALRIMHALGPYQRGFTLKQIDASGEFQEARQELNAWISAVKPADIRKEAALTFLHRADWATGATYLRFDESAAEFSFRDSAEDRKNFEAELETSVEKSVTGHPEMVERIRRAVKEWNEKKKGSKEELVGSLLSFVRQMERDCPSLASDLPGWAGNSMIDFLQHYKESADSQRNCVRESQVVAKILTSLQSRGLLPDSLRVLSYGHAHGREVTLHAPDGTEENHVGTKLLLGEDGTYFIDTWHANAGDKGAAYATMREWHKAFSRQSKGELRQLEELKTGLALPDGVEAHHPEHQAKWDFIFLRFFTGQETELPAAFTGMFEYMQKMCAHYVVRDYREERNVRSLYNTPRGMRSLRPYVRTYFENLYPNSAAVREAFAG